MEQHTLRAIQSVTSDAPTEDLPLWMRQARRRTDWGVILVVLLSLCISWSFLTRSGINLNSASLNHGFMAADIADGLREGHLYPRWSPHAFGGYGAPIPDYYPPGAAYTVALAEVLFTNDTETALRLIYALAPLLAGSMVYAFVSRRTGAPEGMLAALLYVFSPYFGLVAPHILGDLPGVLVLVLIPALLRSVNRLLMVNQPTDFVWIALATAALLLTRPSGLLAGIALSLILILLHLMDRKRWWRVLLVTIAMVIGVTMAAMYWLPALLELNAVHWIPPDFPAISHILTLSDFLAPLRQIDPGELAPTAQFTPGWVVLGFALVGLIGATTHHHAYRHQLAFLVAAIALIAGTVLFAPQITELTGIITLCLAVGGSAVLAWRQHLPVFLQRISLMLALVLILIGSLNVWLVPLLEQAHPGFQPVNQIQYEQQGSGTAVLTPGSSVPTSLKLGVDFNRNLINSYQGVLEKITPAQLTRTGQIGILAQETHDAHYQLRTSDVTALSCRPNQPSAPNCRHTASVTITWLTAYFPGWQAWWNDLPLNIERNSMGLIEIRLPGTQNNQEEGNDAELVISLGSTPVRNFAWGLSWLAVILTTVITWQRLQQSTHLQYYDNRRLLTPAETRLTAALLITFGIVFALVAPSDARLSLRARPGISLQGIEHYSVQTDVGLQLFGYQFNQPEYHPGDTMVIALYWRALRPLPDNYRVRLYLEDVNRLIDRVEQPLRDPAGFPTREWTTSGYVRDLYELHLPDDIFTGNYRVTLEVIACDKRAECTRTNRLTFFEPQSNPGRNSIPEKTLQLPAVIKLTDG